MKKGMILFVVATISLLLLFNRCMFNDADSLYDGPAFISSLKVYGMVNDINGNPIENVRINTENATGQEIYTYTDSLGFFSFDQVRARDNRIVLEADKEGYFHKSFATSSPKNDAKVRFVMNEKTMTTMSASTNNSVVVSEKATVHFEANSLVTESGTPYQGEVQVAYTYADPQSPVFSLTMQGGDLRGINSNQQEQHLISYGALAVELSSSSGAPLNLAPGQTATIEMTVSDEQLVNAPATIPLWYFDDEKNVWKEEGYATLQGNKYIGQVSHFSWWNCDDPISPNTFVTGKVFDCNNNPLAGMAVSVGPLVVYTNADGAYISNVASGLMFEVVVSALLNGGISSLPISVSGVPAGTTMNLEDIYIPCAANISGTVNKCSGQSVFVKINVPGFWSDFKPVNENFNLIVNTGTNYTLTFKVSNPQYSSTYHFTVPALGPEQNYIIPSVIQAGCPVTVSGKLIDCSDNPISGQITAAWDGNTIIIPVLANGLFSFYAPTGSSVSITAKHIYPISFFKTFTTSIQTTSGSESFIVPPIQFSCPSTINGVITSCSGSPITTTVKMAWDGQVKYVLAPGGYYTAVAPGGEVIDVSAQEFVGGGIYSGETSVNTISNEAVAVTLPLCTLELQTECPIIGVQFTGNGNTVNFTNLYEYNTAAQISLPQTTSTPGLHVMTPYSVPAGYTHVYVNDGPIGFSLLLPQPIQTGLYNIGTYTNIAFGHPIGVMMVNNTTPTFILTQGQINVTEASGTTLSGNFSGSAGTIIGISQVATPNILEVVGDFCITY